jgi:hypothetical protein
MKTVTVCWLGHLTYGDNRVVGGDAYNFIICSIRGLMFVALGLVFAIMASAAGAIRDRS